MRKKNIIKKIISFVLVLTLISTNILAFATEIDASAPTIKITTVDKTLVVDAQDDTGLESLLYTFNKGGMWQKENFVAVTKTTIWLAGEIGVKDLAGNTTYTTEDVTIDVQDTNQSVANSTVVADKTAPVISIMISGLTVTVNAQDNVGLHTLPYSFDGGKTWQAENIFTATEAKIWNVADILVKDTAFNVAYNREIASVPDGAGTSNNYLPPAFDIKTEGSVISAVVTNNANTTKYLYSFDGGAVWQRSNKFAVVKDSRTWKPGDIIVLNDKDVSNYNMTEVFLQSSGDIDDTAPEFIIQVKGDVLTLTIQDNDILPQRPYSFDGGKTWTESNRYTVVGEKIWNIGEILVSNSSGYVGYNREVISAPQEIDIIPPTVSFVHEKLKLTINATDNIKLHTDPYSFDGGKTFGAINIATVNEGETKEFKPGDIWVRDAAGNTYKNTQLLQLPKPDNIPPVISITSNNGVVTITATDDEALAAAAYSFDNGATWQQANTYKVSTGVKVWNIGEIQVRDVAGNISKNTIAITAQGQFSGNASCIDVSAYQGNINWAAVKASGVEYAIMRAVTWSGGQSGYWVIDQYFEKNVKEAKANGIKVGAYIYSYAFNEQEIGQEVAVFRACADRLRSQGYTFDLPVFVDYEYNPILEAVAGVPRRTELLRYEMVLLDQIKYYPGMYMSTSWAQNHVNAKALQNEGYDLWIADYRGYNGYGSSVVMWQYTSTANVSGVSGNTDMNYLYKDYSNIINGSNNSGSIPTESLITVYDSVTGTNVTDSKLNILSAITNNEVGNIDLTGNDRAKMYKAQAVAANSWLSYQIENKNTIPQVSLKKTGNYELVKSTIDPVKSYLLTYNGKAANAMYGSCNNGYTNTQQNYYGSGSFPYLVTVQSPYDNKSEIPPYFGKTLVASKSKMIEELKKIGIDAVASGYSEPNWITITARDPVSNYVTGLQVCGKNVSVASFYENVYGPYSADFTVSYSNNTFTFVSNGFGSGIGMSQLGARGYFAHAGKSWEEVLAIYFPGTTLQTN